MTLKKDRPILELILKDAKEREAKQIGVPISKVIEITEEEIKKIIDTELNRLTPTNLNLKLPTKGPLEIGLDSIDNACQNELDEPYIAYCEFERYMDQKVPEYLDNYEKYIRSLIQLIEYEHRCLKFKLFVENSGGSPAKGVQIEIGASDGIILAREKWIKTQLRPRPPEIPVVRSCKERRRLLREKLLRSPPYSPDISSLRSRLIGHSRGTCALCWKETMTRNHTERLILECEEFMHGDNASIILFHAFITEEGFDGGTIFAEIFASNYPQRPKVSVTIHTSSKT